MANADRPSGFSPAGEVKRQNVYQSGSAIAKGDAVVKASDGQIDPCATGGSSHATAVLGVAMESASAAGQDVLVCDDPDQEYEIQADGADVDAQTDIGLNYAILGTDPSGGESRQELDSDTGATAATLPLKLMRISRQVGNALGANVKCVVKINASQNGNGTIGV